MKPPVETVRISKKGRDILLKLKRQTGVENWNVLCRWALMASLREKKRPSLGRENSEGGIEMSWKVFAGEYSDVFAAMVTARAISDGYDGSNEDTADCLRAHLARGLEYLGSGFETKSIASFLSRWALGQTATKG
ncbi:MAG: DNA sulfur modification protein DndE [Nibricoccus sp.]